MNLTRTICWAAMFAGIAMPGFADPPSQPTSFRVTAPTKVPGLTLKPGTYTIRMVDQLSDRIIVRVDDDSANVHSTFIGLQNPEIAKPAAPGLVSWNGADAGYVRGYYFANLPSVVEFVYPKADAVKIAQKIDSKVPAIDPASEGRVTDKNLTHDDMELVTLWLLSSTRVGPGGGSAAIQAERYKRTAPASTDVASSTPAAPQTPVAPATGPVSAAGESVPQTSSASAHAPVTQAQPQQVAELHRPKRVVSALPHTGSELPLIALVGGLSMAGGFTVRRFAKTRA